MTATRVSSLYAVTRYGVQLHQVILCYRLQCSPMIPLKIAWRTLCSMSCLSRSRSCVVVVVPW